jgi:pectate lyase
MLRVCDIKRYVMEKREKEMKIIFKTSLLLMSFGVAHANNNYHECLFNEHTGSLASKSGQTTAIYCTINHFDTAPTAFQAQVLTQELDEMKARDPAFKAFYNNIRKNSSNDIYTDRQIVLMYIDKREVNKEMPSD